MKNVDSQLDFIFDIRSPRTNFSSQSINYIDNQDDDELIMTPDMETGLIG
nr:Bm11107 [Brugia malayi]